MELVTNILQGGVILLIGFLLNRIFNQLDKVNERLDSMIEESTFREHVRQEERQTDETTKILNKMNTSIHAIEVAMARRRAGDFGDGDNRPHS